VAGGWLNTGREGHFFSDGALPNRQDLQDSQDKV